MECENCDGEMRHIGIQDTGDDSCQDDYVHNLWLCELCKSVSVERVWSCPGMTTIEDDGTVIENNPNKG